MIQFNSILSLKRILLLVLVTCGLMSSTTHACPSGCKAYANFYVILTSGFSKQEVLSKGKKMAAELNAPFAPEASASQRNAKCGQGNCVFLLSSSEDPIGHPDSATKVYAAGFTFWGLQYKKADAEAVLKKTKAKVPDAYLKIDKSQCACE